MQYCGAASARACLLRFVEPLGNAGVGPFLSPALAEVSESGKCPRPGGYLEQLRPVHRGWRQPFGWGCAQQLGRQQPSEYHQGGCPRVLSLGALMGSVHGREADSV